ncbi:MAG: ABC transporter permease subunit [Spirochaeta sp.]|jgi:oligopeptide transport system permease protein|nr:ABC transporter permease subunit [Spirochaeta sp.]
MTQYIIRRFLGLFPTLLIIITISFFIIRVAPGGPFDREKALPPQIMENIEAKYDMDKPLIVQYGLYMWDIMRGDLGPSYRYMDRDVNYYIFSSLPASMLLGVISLTISIVLGVTSGVISALRQNKLADYLSMSIAVIGISVPLFVIGPVLMYFLALQWQLLPTSGWIGGRNGWLPIIMPAITLSFLYFAYIARLTRASVIEVLRSDYVRTARAKGLKESVIIFKHVLKGALLPVVSFLGPAFAGIITGSVVVEQIFRVPGLGRFFVQSAFNRDYTLIMGTVIVFSAILVVMNFVVDIVYALLDPRISYK